MSFSEWREVKLGDICNVKGGKRLPKGTGLTSTPNSHPYIRIRDMYQHKYLELNNEFEYVDEETFQCISRYIVDKGDVIIAIVGNTIGLVSMIGKSLNNASLTENCVKLANLKDCLSEYLYYHLISDYGQSDIKRRIVGTSQPKLPIYNIQDMEIKLPPLPEQKAIAATLSCLDDKIELNNRINKTLEEMAQAIFKSWFVDFEPFQDGEFEDSELGRIPKGWKVGCLGEIIDLYDSKRIPLSSRQREGLEKKYPYYGATSIMDYVDKYIFDGIYLLLGEDGSVIDENEYPFLQYVWGKFWVNNHAHVIKGKNGFSEEYLFTLLKKVNVRSIITGAVQLKINQGNLCNLSILIPESDVIERFNFIVKVIFAMYRKNIEESRSLTTIRDSLLPKLMSGEIRVPVKGVS